MKSRFLNEKQQIFGLPSSFLSNIQITPCSGEAHSSICLREFFDPCMHRAVGTLQFHMLTPPLITLCSLRLNNSITTMSTKHFSSMRIAALATLSVVAAVPTPANSNGGSSKGDDDSSGAMIAIVAVVVLLLPALWFFNKHALFKMAKNRSTIPAWRKKLLLLPALKRKLLEAEAQRPVQQSAGNDHHTNQETGIVKHEK